MNDINFLSDLNEAQREAVVNYEGPSLVIAGAGSGKTRVLTYRIAYLLQQGVKAQNILALTFTNKAAKEMKKRIGQLVGEQRARYLWMGTFHSIFAKILRQECNAIGYVRDYTIYDTADSSALIKQILKEMQLDDKVYKFSSVLARISMAKNNLLSPLDYASERTLINEDRASRMPRMSDIYFTYNKRLKQANAMDFDDLLFNMNLLLENNADIKEKYRNIFQYILVDEYQDTNHCQARIVAQLANPRNNICVVGDDAQSIYSFRGAVIGNILSFQKTYPNSKLFKLERNYRSTKTIVNAANCLIEKNRDQIKKNVYSEKEQGDLIELSYHNDDREEAKYVANQINKQIGNTLIHKERFNYDDIAVLYRNNNQSRSIEDELRKLNIPYRIYGNVSFYQRREIKDAISYFRLIVNTDDDEALRRIINVPARGIGDTTKDRVFAAAHEVDVPAFKVVAQPTYYNLESNASTKNRLQAFAQMITIFQSRVETLNAYEFADLVLKQTQLLSSALMSKKAEDQDRYDNLQELLGSILEFVTLRKKEEQSCLITDFLEEVALLTNQDENEQEDDTPKVTLMTAHAAKGLEFPIVFITGLEENVFPSIFAETPQDMEEERRLLYVAITRAGYRCFMTHAGQRFRNGQITFSTPSRFLKDIDNQYFHRSKDTTPRRSWQPSWKQAEWEEPAPAPIPQPIQPTKKLVKTTGMQVATGKVIIDSGFDNGQRVRHTTFGDGTVKDSFSENGNDKILIHFDKYGEKTLLLKFAKLTKL